MNVNPGKLESRLPVAKYEMVEFAFTNAATDHVIPHSLSPSQPHEVRFVVVDQNKPGVISRGSKAPGDDYIVLRASVIGTYRIMLFIEANAGVTFALPAA